MTKVRNVSRTRRSSLNPPTITTRNWGGARAADRRGPEGLAEVAWGRRRAEDTDTAWTFPSPQCPSLQHTQSAQLGPSPGPCPGGTVHLGKHLTRRARFLSGLRNEQNNYEAAPPWAGQAALLTLELGPEC